MKVYRKNKKTGFVETLETVGNYKPKGWTTYYTTAQRQKI